MAVAQSTNWSRIIRQAIIAGVVGAIAIHLFLYVVAVLPTHGSIITLWQWIASVAFGKWILTNPLSTWIGLAVHFFVSIAWAGGYAFLASTRPYMNQRWPISGLAYGLIIFFFMQLMLLAVNAEHPSEATGFAIAIIACSVFYGLPVAYTVSRLDRA
jgi:hypothetical protein